MAKRESEEKYISKIIIDLYSVIGNYLTCLITI